MEIIKLSIFKIKNLFLERGSKPIIVIVLGCALNFKSYLFLGEAPYLILLFLLPFFIVYTNVISILLSLFLSIFNPNFLPLLLLSIILNIHLKIKLSLQLILISIFLLGLVLFFLYYFELIRLNILFLSLLLLASLNYLNFYDKIKKKEKLEFLSLLSVVFLFSSLNYGFETTLVTVFISSVAIISSLILSNYLAIRLFMILFLSGQSFFSIDEIILFSMLLFSKEIFSISKFLFDLKKPFVISISGDSSTGKDSLADVMINILGKNECTKISGDDFHKWDRNKTNWENLTHLNPKANNLGENARSIRMLSSNESTGVIKYDHETGSKAGLDILNPSKFILSVGLHSLYQINRSFISDISIFINMEEKLRRKLKIRRDTLMRGHSEPEVLNSIKKREQDSSNYIFPQKNQADIIINIRTIDEKENSNLEELLNNLSFEVITKIPSDFEFLKKITNGINTISLEVEEEIEYQKIIFSGSISSNDLLFLISHYKDLELNFSSNIVTSEDKNIWYFLTLICLLNLRFVREGAF